MIDIGNDWYIEVDDMGNYMPRKDLHRIDTITKKDGTIESRKAFSAPVGYFGSLSGAIRGLVKVKVKDGLKGDISLAEAIKRIDEITGEFETMLDKALKGQ